MKEKTNKELAIEQSTIDAIIKRAKESNYGLDDIAKTPLNFDSYSQQNLESLALVLVNAFEQKYDLVSIFKAALEEVSAQATAASERKCGELGAAINEANWILSGFIDAGGGATELKKWATQANEWRKVSYEKLAAAEKQIAEMGEALRNWLERSPYATQAAREETEQALSSRQPVTK